MPAENKKGVRALVGWNTGQRVHKQSKGAGEVSRNRGKVRAELKKQAQNLNR
tara:strand:+ start:1709 stop:1864 length:156 start_codon:yes stop_codon:yes gene_type:complete